MESKELAEVKERASKLHQSIRGLTSWRDDGLALGFLFVGLFVTLASGLSNNIALGRIDPHKDGVEKLMMLLASAGFHLSWQGTKDLVDRVALSGSLCCFSFFAGVILLRPYNIRCCIILMYNELDTIAAHERWIRKVQKLLAKKQPGSWRKWTAYILLAVSFLFVPVFWYILVHC